MFDEIKAKEIIEREGLSMTTLRVWKTRGKIPEKYMEEAPRIYLGEVLEDKKIEWAIDRYGDEMRRLIESRKFKPDLTYGYYMRCLLSLCREVKTYDETGKLS